MIEYKQLVSLVLSKGVKRIDRTGTGTISMFSPPRMSFYLTGDYLPLVTTKKLNTEAIVKELLWFLRGETNTRTLGCGIWDEWAGPDGELGPIYGHQWRRANGRDQLGDVVRELACNPTSRRLVVSAWNPDDVPRMALPPCHTMFQLYVRAGIYLDLHLYQRSADLALGVPFNIASYALLCHLIARSTGLAPGRLLHTIGDAHIYSDHVEGLKVQMSRRVSCLKPKVTIIKKPDFSSPEAWNIEPEDIKISYYNPQPAIRFKVAV